MENAPEIPAATSGPEKPATASAALASNLRKYRVEKELSLEEVAKSAGISKTYLWELERDTDGAKNPSVDVLLRIGKALSRTLAELLSLPTVQVKGQPVQLPPALKEFRDRYAHMGEPISEADLQDLATIKFRGGQPTTADEWLQLFLLLRGTGNKPK
jgi:transcriptional regulator with XRE-family HTH domain